MEMRRNTRRLIAFLTILSFFTVTIGMPSDVQAAHGRMGQLDDFTR